MTTKKPENDLMESLVRELTGETANMEFLVQQLRKSLLAQLATTAPRPRQTKDDEQQHKPSRVEVENFVIKLQKESVDSGGDTKIFDRILKYIQTGDDRE